MKITSSYSITRTVSSDSLTGVNQVEVFQRVTHWRP